MNRIYNVILLAGMALLSSCGGKENGGSESGKGPDEIPAEECAISYTTSSDRSRLFVEQKIPFLTVPDPSAAEFTVTLDPSSTYQTIDGFGAALTGASCYNLLKMSQSDRTAFLKELFDPEEGLGFGLIRVSIGASDFSVDDEFTWCDREGLENFAVHKEDRDYLFPILREVYAINPDVRIIASPWSAPRWMKRRSVTDDSDYYSWTSGSLKPSCYRDYAQYFVKWIQTMEEEGFNIYAMTIQNEPLNHGNSMSMYMTWQEQRDFINTALGPAFAEAGITAKILVYDHNYDQKSYTLNIYADQEAASYVAGSAWHNYLGSVSTLSSIHKAAPDKDIYFTEASIGSWNYNFASCLIDDFKSIFIQTMDQWNRGVTLWNLMLDENNGPYRPGGCATCYGAVTVLSSSGVIKDRNSHYYNLAHASKVIRPGAVRIAADGYSVPEVSYLAFRNPDGSIAVIMVNEGEESRRFVFKDGTRTVQMSVPARSIESLIWK